MSRMRGPGAVFDGFLGQIVTCVSQLRINTKYRIAIQQLAKSWLVALPDISRARLNISGKSVNQDLALPCRVALPILLFSQFAGAM